MALRLGQFEKEYVGVQIYVLWRNNTYTIGITCKQVDSGMHMLFLSRFDR